MLVRVNPHMIGTAWARPMRKAEQRTVSVAARHRERQSKLISFIRANSCSSVVPTASSYGRTVPSCRRVVNGKTPLSHQSHHASPNVNCLHSSDPAAISPACGHRDVLKVQRPPSLAIVRLSLFPNRPVCPAPRLQLPDPHILCQESVVRVASLLIVVQKKKRIYPAGHVC